MYKNQNLGTRMPAGFEQFIRGNMGRIRRIALRYAEIGESEDLSQEILIALWRGYKGFRGDSKPETWMYRIAFNTAMTSVRKSIRKREGESKLKSLSRMEDFSSTGFSETDILTTFLNSLNEIDASVLMMYLDGLSADEMEKVLGVKANAIGVRVNRIKQKYIKTHVE